MEILWILVYRLVLFSICIWFLCMTAQYFFFSDKIETKVPLKPEIQISIIDGKTDTTYIYTIN